MGSQPLRRHPGAIALVSLDAIVVVAQNERQSILPLMNGYGLEGWGGHAMLSGETAGPDGLQSTSSNNLSSLL